MEPAAPTPQELYARLRSLSNAPGDEELAHELGIKIRTLTRLKAGEGTQYETTIKLLAAAGWLDLDSEADARARLEQAQKFVDSGLGALEALREAVVDVLEKNQSGHQDQPED
jgi:transcriptional regulator with XRE-family HTH domain